jgi:hypothetical protein
MGGPPQMPRSCPVSAAPQLRVPHPRDSFIVDRLGIAPRATALLDPPQLCHLDRSIALFAMRSGETRSALLHPTSNRDIKPQIPLQQKICHPERSEGPASRSQRHQCGYPILATASSSIGWASRKARPHSSIPPQLCHLDRSIALFAMRSGETCSALLHPTTNPSSGAQPKGLS